MVVDFVVVVVVTIMTMLFRFLGAYRAKCAKPSSLWPRSCRPSSSPSLPSRRFASRLVFSSYGPPAEVVTLEHFDPPSQSSLPANSVLVRMLISPVNPADVNVIQGSYPIRPSAFPAIGGGEGVGVVDSVAEEGGDGLKVGDWVVPSYNMDGTWTTHLVSDQSRLIKVSFITFGF